MSYWLYYAFIRFDKLSNFYFYRFTLIICPLNNSRLLLNNFLDFVLMFIFSTFHVCNIDQNPIPFPIEHINKPTETLTYIYFVKILFHVMELRVKPSGNLKRFEMVLHHFSTITLIVFSWYYLLPHYGFYIMYLHDVSDTWMYLIRGISTVDENSRFLIPVSIILVITWFRYRILFLGEFVYNVFYFSGDLCLSELIVIQTLLSILLILNIYWFSLVLRKAFVFLIKGK